jgi:hypothetical protein
MIDVISLSIAIGAILISALSHIRRSKCYGVEIETRGSKGSVPESPIENEKNINNINNINESTALLIESKPIDITNRRKVVKNWL